MDKELLMGSLLLVDGQEHLLTPTFYDLLFEAHPEVRSMFSTDIEPQAEMLRGAIIAVLDHHPQRRLDDPDALRAQLAPKPRQADLFG